MMFLSLGGGGAGLRASIAAAAGDADVLMVSKTRIGQATNTYLSKAIIASSGWGDADDNSNVHGQDTLQGGRYLNDPGMVTQFAGAIRQETKLLQEWGVDYISGNDGNPTVMKIPGHSFARHLVGKNWTGRDLVLPLKKKAKESGVRFEEGMFVSSLIVSGNRVCGASCVSKDGRFLAINAKTIVLATGGFGQLYLNTNNAPGITGDGQALAANIGVMLRDMEFVQYYPTTLGKQGSQVLLYERLLVQDGAVLKNSRGQDILKKNGYNVPGDITRDQLAQVIMKEILENPDQGNFVDLDLSSLSPETAKTLSALLPAQWTHGVKVFQVTPTTHFCMGGVIVDKDGETSCNGLFAAGEVTAGAHGANRLGGNALAEAIGMGSLVGKAAVEKAMGFDPVDGFDIAADQALAHLESLFSHKGHAPKDLVKELKTAMWFDAGIVRNQQSLKKALETIIDRKDVLAIVETPRDLIQILEFKNMQFIGEIVCRSALIRTESRGSHFRSDYPGENNDDWRLNIQVRQTDSGLVFEQVPVPGVTPGLA